MMSQDEINSICLNLIPFDSEEGKREQEDEI